jgi:hypothetical protein
VRAPAFAVVFAALGFVSPARADTMRVRVPLSALPRQDEPIKIDAKSAMLPDGVREGSPVPKTWRTRQDWGSDELGHCTDGRRGSVSSTTATETSTEKIWETNGKVFFDRARVTIADGKVHVRSAERVPVVYVSESIWAYRRGGTVRLVMARDAGVFTRAIFWGCSVDETAVSSPVGTTATSSSPDQVNEVIKQLRAMNDDKNVPAAPWKGVELTLVASVSKASADAEPMLNLVIKRP